MLVAQKAPISSLRGVSLSTESHPPGPGWLSAVPLCLRCSGMLPTWELGPAGVLGRRAAPCSFLHCWLGHGREDLRSLDFHAKTLGNYSREVRLED